MMNKTISRVEKSSIKGSIRHAVHGNSCAALIINIRGVCKRDQFMISIYREVCFFLGGGGMCLMKCSFNGF